jgi:hypothetical protein
VLGRGVLLAAALAACGAPAAALPVRVDLDWPAGRPAPEPARARLQAVRTAGSTGGGVPVEAQAGPDGVVLDLGDGVWQVQASAPGYWSPAAEVAVGGPAPASVRLALWPAASLHGQVLTAGSDPLPRDLELRLSAAPAPAGAPSPSSAALRCPIHAGAWSCPGPAGLFDVHLQAAGFAPRYAWEVSLQAGASTDLGRTVLRRAASVFGRAVRGDGASPEGPCRATLREDGTRRSPLETGAGSAREGGDRSLSVPLSRRGYFQLAGVAPGGHLLAVECPAASGFRELRVQADRETRIDPPLVLEDLTLDIAIMPRVDPAGRPWQLTVDATAPRGRRIADRAAASADGRWTRRGLTAGSYRVALESAGGTQQLLRFFELGAGSGPLSLRVGFVEVAGRVLLGLQPLRARLVFVNEAGGEPATLTSDDGGRFQGLLPVAPGAPETRWTVEAHAAQPPIHRRLEGVRVEPVAGGSSAWLELALPMVAVRGTVVSEGGKPQSGAQVTFADTRGGTATATATDDAGSFELLELPPGSYTAVAESVAGVSERTAFDAVEGVEGELHLVLHGAERVAFHVVSSQGPVAGAAVQVWSGPGVPRGFARTDADGRFEVKLPPGTTEVGLTVGAPGHALKLIRLPASNEATIMLGTSGGTLVLDLQRPGSAPDGSTPYLLHDGAIEAAGELAGWGRADAGGPSVVEAIEPGVYALCLAGPGEVAALWRGALPADRCRTGSVEPGRTLTLSAP